MSCNGITVVTCSSLGTIVRRYRRERSVSNLYLIDDAMGEDAVRRENRLAMIVNAASTIEPSRTHLQMCAERITKRVAVETINLDIGHMQSVLEERCAEKRDRTLSELNAAVEGCDVTVLAQVSTAVLFEWCGLELCIPVLNSYEMFFSALLGHRVYAQPGRPELGIKYYTGGF